MAEVIELKGRKASNLIGALGEIIAWNTLQKMGIQSYKIGIWSFFPQYYFHRGGELIHDDKFLTREQANFVEKKVEYGILDYDFVGVKWKHGIRGYSISEVEGVYLIEVKTGRNIRYLVKNPIKAIATENLEIAKVLGFKVLVITVEILENWRCRVATEEL